MMQRTRILPILLIVLSSLQSFGQDLVPIPVDHRLNDQSFTLSETTRILFSAGLVARLIEKHPGRVRTVFLGYAEINAEDKVRLVKKFNNGESDWLTNESDKYIRDHIGNMIAYSKVIKKRCEKHGVPYFDTSEDFWGAIEAATDCLLPDSARALK